MLTPYSNMPLLTFFATHALAAVDKTKSPQEKAEEAFEIGKFMLEMHVEHRTAPGCARLAGELKKEQ